MIEVVAYESEYFEFYKGSFKDFQKHIDQAFLKIPKEYLGSMQVEMEGVDQYGTPDISMRVTYERPETAQEYMHRTNSIMAEHASKEKKERAMLKELQEKYKNENI